MREMRDPKTGGGQRYQSRSNRAAAFTATFRNSNKASAKYLPRSHCVYLIIHRGNDISGSCFKIAQKKKLRSMQTAEKRLANIGNIETE